MKWYDCDMIVIWQSSSPLKETTHVFFIVKYPPNPPFYDDFWGILTTWMTWWMGPFKVCNLACAWTGLDLKEPQGWESVTWIETIWNHMKPYTILQMDWHRKIRMLILMIDGCWIFVIILIWMMKAWDFCLSNPILLQLLWSQTSQVWENGSRGSESTALWDLCSSCGGWDPVGLSEPLEQKCWSWNRWNRCCVILRLQRHFYCSQVPLCFPGCCKAGALCSHFFVAISEGSFHLLSC